MLVLYCLGNERRGGGSYGGRDKKLTHRHNVILGIIRVNCMCNSLYGLVSNLTFMGEGQSHM